MTKKLLSAFILLISIQTFAQEQPRLLLGGDIQLSGEGVFEEVSYYGSVSISAGYFVTKGWLFGMEGSVSISPVSRYYEAVPIVRYHLHLTERDVLYVGARGGYGWGSDLSIISADKKHRFAWLWGARTGYLNRVTENVGIDIFAFYNSRHSSSQKQDGFFTEPSVTTVFGLGIGLQVWL
ncbi:MAG: hypothetical protein HWE14_13055 [Flavobacteriia bacterium]|nr:hypothetical protein [Flavobacteriia bacterium]